MNVAITAGYVAHLRPKYLAEMPRQGLYTAGRRIRFTMRFHRFPQKSFEGKHEKLEASEPGDEEGGDAAEMDGVEGERNEEKEKDYREEKQQPGKANGSHFCSEETVGERETISELVVEQTIDDQDYL
nr:hypothetical protein Iba_chr06eCG3430 [Ipomoea batatas]